MEWKMAKVIPIFKSGSMAEIDNYRPTENFRNIDYVVTSHKKDQDKQTVQKSQTNL